MGFPFRCWVEVDLAALAGNLAWIRHRVGRGVKVMAVVKADAYGHGLKQIAGHLMQNGTDLFGVANLAEAQSIRAVGKGWPILMLGPCLPEEVDIVVREGLMPTVSSEEEIVRFASAADRLKRRVAVQLKIDTGMGRLGAIPKEGARLVRQIRSTPSLRLAGVYTHFASAEEDPIFSRAQESRFGRFLEAAGLRKDPPAYLHASNSAALLLHPRSHYNTVRPGLLVFGVVPPGRRPVRTELKRRVRPVLSWKCRVGFIKEIARGTSISYGRAFKAPRRMQVATLTAGYGDGYLRAGSGKAEVLVAGRRCPVLGRITMDQMMVDVSGLAVQPGDEAVLVGSQGDGQIRAGEVAAWCGTIPWEILTHIHHRVARIYRGGVAA